MSRQAVTEEMVTAYALGELDARDREAVEAHLAGSEGGRRQVEEVRGTAKLLTDELLREQGEASRPVRRAGVEQRTGGSRRRGWVVGLGIAAGIVLCGAVPLWYWEHRDRYAASSEQGL